MKRLLPLLLVLALLLGCASGPVEDPQGTMGYTDSLKRDVTVCVPIGRIAITGPLSQIYILPLAGDLLVGVSNAFSADAALYLPEEIFSKAQIGQLYGGKGEMDLESLLSADPDLVIDIGEPKSSMAEDLNKLQDQTGIPFVHVDATVKTAPEAYRTLGMLLDRREKAEELAVWLEDTYTMIESMMGRVDADGARKTVLYCLGDKGTNVIARGSFHAETIDLMAQNLAVLDDAAMTGLGSEVDLEQLLLWDPDVLLFAPDSCYASVADDPQWQSLGAVARGTFYRTPEGPYGWLSSPPGVQRYLGMLWLGTLLYPEYADYDLQVEVTEYYRLFYGCELTQELYQSLMTGALPG